MNKTAGLGPVLQGAVERRKQRSSGRGFLATYAQEGGQGRKVASEIVGLHPASRESHEDSSFTGSDEFSSSLPIARSLGGVVLTGVTGGNPVERGIVIEPSPMEFDGQDLEGVPREAIEGKEGDESQPLLPKDQAGRR